MKKKFYYIDFLRIFSMLSVIMLHVVADLLRVKYGSVEWHFSNIITSVISVAVPVFFMISGATLINYNKRYTTKQFFSKRFKRTVIPFLFFSAIPILSASGSVAIITS